MKCTTFAKRLSEALTLRGMTAAELSRRMGISEAVISQYRSGKYEPKQDRLDEFARILDVNESWLMGYDVPSTRTSPQIRKTHKGVRIPVYGYVAAGVPIEAITNYDSEDPDDWEEIPEEMATSGDYIALRIKGDSMEPKFSPGDVVIVRLQEDADSGDIVIAMVNGDEATCKKLQKSADGIMLVALNPAYAPMYFSRKECIDIPVRILGRVVELRAKF